MIDGVTNSPLDLGILQLDRTAPTASSILLTPAGRDGRGGLDPVGRPVGDRPGRAGDGRGQRRARPADADGAWVPFAEQPSPGDGRKLARTSLAGLPDGRTWSAPARATGRATTPRSPSGSSSSDGTAPTVSASRSSARRGDDADRRAVLHGRPTGPASGWPPDGRGSALVGRGDDADLAVPGEPGPGRVLVQLPASGSFTRHASGCATAWATGARAPRSRSACRRRPGRPTRSPGRCPSSARRGAVAPGADVTWAYRQVRTLPRAARGAADSATLRVARARSGWRQLLGGPAADRYAGYADLRGTVLLGPAATAGTREHPRGAGRGAGPLARRRRRRGDGPRRAPARDAPRDGPGVADGLAAPRGRGARSRRGSPRRRPRTCSTCSSPASTCRPRCGAPLAAGVRRRAHAYRAGGGVRAADVAARDQVGAATSAKARAWRIRVADTWGADRWKQLSRRHRAQREGAAPAGGCADHPGCPPLNRPTGAGAAGGPQTAAVSSASSSAQKCRVHLGAAALGGPPVHVGEVGHDQRARDHGWRGRGRRRIAVGGAAPGGRGPGRGRGGAVVDPQVRRGSPRPLGTVLHRVLHGLIHREGDVPQTGLRPAAPRSCARSTRGRGGRVGRRGDARRSGGAGRARGRIDGACVGPGHDEEGVPGRRVATRAAVAWNGVREGFSREGVARGPLPAPRRARARAAAPRAAARARRADEGRADRRALLRPGLDLRAQARRHPLHRDQGRRRVRLLSRNDLSLNGRFPEIAAALEADPAADFVRRRRGRRVRRRADELRAAAAARRAARRRSSTTSSTCSTSAGQRHHRAAAAGAQGAAAPGAARSHGPVRLTPHRNARRRGAATARRAARAGRA